MSFFAVYRRVLAQLAPEAALAILLALANIAVAAAQFAEPLLFGRIIDRLTGAQTQQAPLVMMDLAPMLGAWVGFGLFSIAGSALVALNADRLSHRRRLGMMAAYFDHVLHLPLSFHSLVHSGRLLKIMLDGAQAMFWIWLSFFRENCASAMALFVLLPMTLFVNWRLAAILIVLVICFGLLTSFVLRRTETLQGAVERFSSDLAEHASDALGNVPVIQSFTRVESESRAMRRIIDALLAAQMPVLSWWAIAAVATRASSTLSILSIFLVGIWLHLHDLATVGEIVTFINFATMLIGRLEQMVGFVNSLFMQTGRVRDFFEVIDTRAIVEDRPNAIDPGRLTGRVVFDRVGFSYDGARQAVSDISFAVEPGQTIALVGATGSGKSTTMSLLHRVFDPTSGGISIDGIDIRDMRLVALRRNIGVVFQEPMLFARSIEENLRVGKPDATPAELELALERAQAKDFVARQTEGLLSRVGERGRSLSGGERQRVSIARALLKDPPIMIFDEATSALDATTERQIQAALDAATKGRTTFVIAHRLATIRNADRILVFEAGRIVESGSFEELVALDGRFAQLARAQFMAPALASPGPAARPAGQSTEISAAPI
ncbi:MAG: glucan ABC transporter ATP-binding protein/ permease [Hyphomicrobiales bacterium]|nr:glucan ABC transporter ATP-binding protein/ permease [Hyphomicrobiales bacterium]